MALEIAGEILGGALRFVGSIVFEFVFDVLIRGAGYLICRPFKKSIDPDSAVVAVVGIVFWVGVVGVAYAIYRQLR